MLDEDKLVNSHGPRWRDWPDTSRWDLRKSIFVVKTLVETTQIPRKNHHLNISARDTGMNVLYMI